MSVFNIAKWLCIAFVLLVSLSLLADVKLSKQSVHDQLFLGTCGCGDFCDCCDELVVAAKKAKK